MFLDLGLAGDLHLFGAAAVIAGTMALWFPGKKPALAAAAMLCLGGTLLTTELVIRGVVGGRVPVIGTYENTLVVSVLIAFASASLCLAAAAPIRGSLSRLVAPWALIALLYGSRFSSELLPIGVEGRGALAGIHGIVGWVDFTILLVATMAAVGMLVDRRKDSAPWQPILSRSLAAGFVGLTATMATGALLSFAIFGSWYQWQIVEALAALLWLAYALAIHALLLFGWKHKRLARLTLALGPVMLAAFWSWSVFSSTYHYFERIL